jgi:hypothetical protein
LSPHDHHHDEPEHTHASHDACHTPPFVRPGDPARGGVHQSTHPSALLTELRAHVPFSVTAVAIGLIVAGTICILGYSTGPESAWSEHSHAAHAAGHGAEGNGHDHDHDHDHDHNHAEPVGGASTDTPSDGHDHDHDHTPALLFFHLFHPAHMLFSATATAAMFFRYDRRVSKAIIIGLIGAIGVCGISDIVMPQFSLFILGAETPWHICVWEHPGLVLPFALVGVLVGTAAAASVMHGTVVSHSLHVFASTMASIFYMVGPLGAVDWIDRVGAVFLFVVLAVMVPCCLSDIVFPMLMTRSGRAEFEEEPHAH